MSKTNNDLSNLVLFCKCLRKIVHNLTVVVSKYTNFGSLFMITRTCFALFYILIYIASPVLRHSFRFLWSHPRKSNKKKSRTRTNFICLKEIIVVNWYKFRTRLNLINYTTIINWTSFFFKRRNLLKLWICRTRSCNCFLFLSIN